MLTQTKKRYNVWWCQMYWLGNECLGRNLTEKQAEKIIKQHQQYDHIDIWKDEV